MKRRRVAGQVPGVPPPTGQAEPPKPPPRSACASGCRHHPCPHCCSQSMCQAVHSGSPAVNADMHAHARKMLAEYGNFIEPGEYNLFVAILAAVESFGAIRAWDEAARFNLVMSVKGHIDYVLRP